MVRQIQALAVLLSCLPPGGRARQFFSLALGLDEAPWLDRITPVTDPGDDEGIAAWLDRIDPALGAEADEALLSWLEMLWIRSDLTPGEQEMIDLQSDGDAMSEVLAEYRAVVARLRPDR